MIPIMIAPHNKAHLFYFDMEVLSASCNTSLTWSQRSVVHDFLTFCYESDKEQLHTPRVKARPLGITIWIGLYMEAS